jgi:hypothetical protein
VYLYPHVLHISTDYTKQHQATTFLHRNAIQSMSVGVLFYHCTNTIIVLHQHNSNNSPHGTNTTQRSNRNTIQ